MGIAERFARQLARPDGIGGRLLGNAMNLVNGKPARLAVDLLDPGEGEHILDAGCGNGDAILRMLKAANCTVTGVDGSPVMVDATNRLMRRRGLSHAAVCQCAPIENMLLDDRSFDAVLALNVLYFADEAGHFVRALHRVLRPAGRLIVYVTHRDTMQNWAFAGKGMHRLFDETQLTDALVAGGFSRKLIHIREISLYGSMTGLLAYAQRDPESLEYHRISPCGRT